MDFVSPFPLSLNYNYLWVVMCQLTSQVHLIPVKITINILELTHKFLKGVVHLHGLPKSIVSDHDTKFMSRFWMELHRLLGVKLKLNTAFHPEGNGQAEWMVQNVTQVICAAIHPDQHDWVLKVPLTEFAINSSTNKLTGDALFKLIYGHMPHMMVEIPSMSLPGVRDFTQQALDNLQGAHDVIIKSCIDQMVQVNKLR